MSLTLDLSTAEDQRVKITLEQQKQIQKLYKEVSKKIAIQAKKAPKTSSDVLRKQYLNALKKQVDDQLNKIRSEIEALIKGNMSKAAQSVVNGNLDFLKEVGMPIEGAFSYVPDDIVKSIATGQIYQGNWTLSGAIWKSTTKTQQDVQTVIAQGVTENRSAYDIAKELEKYVDPSAKKDWDWSKVYPGTSSKVDYNAQRLARTLISHAYQQSFVKTTQKNPFVTKYKWVSSNSARVCELCASRDGNYYSKDQLPLDHPNGMCTFIAVIEDSPEDIADRIADWALGKPDAELDVFANSLKGES